MLHRPGVCPSLLCGCSSHFLKLSCLAGSAGEKSPFTLTPALGSFHSVSPDPGFSLLHPLWALPGRPTSPDGLRRPFTSVVKRPAGGLARFRGQSVPPRNAATCSEIQDSPPGHPTPYYFIWSLTVLPDNSALVEGQLGFPCY